MDPGTARDGAGVQGSAGRLAFVSELPAASGLPTRRADIALGVDGARRLVLRATPHPAGKPFGPPPPPIETELLRDVDHIEFSYWPRGPGSGWISNWSAKDIPFLVRLRVVFPQGRPPALAGHRCKSAVGAVSGRVIQRAGQRTARIRRGP